jgi:hypothetical protein
MLDLPLVLTAVLLAAVYAFADRFAGGGWPSLDDKLPGRAAFWGGLLGAGAGFVLLGPAGALMGLVWLIWRTPAWKLIPGSSATPRTAKEVAATFVRHAIPIPLSIPVAIWTDAEPVRLAALTGLFALISTAFAAAYAKGVYADGTSPEDAFRANHLQEAARGAVYGACVAVGLGA